MSRALSVCVSLTLLSSLPALGALAPMSALADEPAKASAIELPPGRVFPETVAVEKRIRLALEEPTELQYLDTTLEDVANDLSLRHKIPVMLDLPALSADGKGKETTVSLEVRETSLRNCLRLLFAGQGLTYAVRNDTLLLTTKSGAEALGSTRVYQVHDLLHPAYDVDGPDFDGLMELVVTNVEPESWREVGGVAGTIRFFEGPGVMALVVKQTEEAHDQIADLLTALRAAREPKVAELQRQAPPRRKQTGGFGGAEATDKAEPDDSEKPVTK